MYQDKCATFSLLCLWEFHLFLILRLTPDFKSGCLFKQAIWYLYGCLNMANHIILYGVDVNRILEVYVIHGNATRSIEKGHLHVKRKRNDLPKL